DGIRYFHVTGVQTCALPIFGPLGERHEHRLEVVVRGAHRAQRLVALPVRGAAVLDLQSAARLDVDDVLLLRQAAEERGDRYRQQIGRASCRVRGQDPGVAVR